MTVAPILDVRGLRTAFPSPSGPVNVLDGIDFEVQDGEICHFRFNVAK